jgi:hypothetical protein
MARCHVNTQWFEDSEWEVSTLKYDHLWLYWYHAIGIQPCIPPFTSFTAHMYHAEQLHNLTHLEIAVAAGAKQRHILCKLC